MRLICIVVILLSDVALLVADRPNVLLICVDDLKPNLGCYDDAVAITPNLDALASRGVQFDAAYCNQAVCSPNRNALMTGLRPQTLGIYDLGTNFRKAVPNAVTLSQTFMAAGYRAEGVGKIYHTGHGNTNDTASWSVPWQSVDAKTYALAESRRAMKPDEKGRVHGPSTESADVPDDTYRDGRIAKMAVERLRAAAERRDEPFFMAVGFIKPHLPFVAPQNYWDLYQPASLPMPTLGRLPEDAPHYAGHANNELRHYSDIQPTGPITQQQTRHLIHGYYAATSYADAQIGRVLTELTKMGLDQNTLVVLWGDHGWHLGDHGLWCKHTNYQQATRIPLIISGPGVGNGRTDAIVETVDIYPTLCDLAGVANLTRIDGKSFAGVVADPSKTHRDYVSHVYPRGGRLGQAVRDERYRLVRWDRFDHQTTEAVELYDYRKDALETHNLADERSDVVQRMSGLLDEQPPPRQQVRVPGF